MKMSPYQSEKAEIWYREIVIYVTIWVELLLRVEMQMTGNVMQTT